jgi:RNA-directed DNA polymerase
VVIHCRSFERALAVKASVEARLRLCKLEAHPDKTRIVYCRDSNRREDHGDTQFDFLGYTFRPREAMSRKGVVFTGFLPAISAKAVKAILAEVRSWEVHRKSDKELADLSRMFNAKIRGWVAYYGRYYPTALRRVFRHLDRRLVRWAQKKYRRFLHHQGRAWDWLGRIARSGQDRFAHWGAGMVP